MDGLIAISVLAFLLAASVGGSKGYREGYDQSRESAMFGRETWTEGSELLGMAAVLVEELLRRSHRPSDRPDSLEILRRHASNLERTIKSARGVDLERQSDQATDDRSVEESDAGQHGPYVGEEVEADLDSDEAANKEGLIDDSRDTRVDVIVVPSSSDALHFVNGPRTVIVAGSDEVLDIRIRTATVYGSTDMTNDQHLWLMTKLHRWALGSGGKIVYESAQLWAVRRWVTRHRSGPEV